MQSRSSAAPLPTVLLVAVTITTTLTLVLGVIQGHLLPFGRDEAATIGIAHRSLGGTLRILWDYEGNGTLYYLFMNAWTRLGTGELWMRLPSILAAAATLPALALLARRLFGATVACIAVVLLALMPPFFANAVEARLYAIELLLTVIAVTLLLRAVERRRARDWALFAVVAAAMLYVGLLALVVIGSLLLSLALLPHGRRPGREALAPLLVLAVAALPVVAYALLRNKGQLSWVEPFGLGRIRVAWDTWMGNAGVAVLCAIAVVAWLVAIARVLRRRGVERWHQALVALWGIGLPLALIAVSLVGQSSFEWTYLTMSIPALVLMVALGVTQLRRPQVVAVATAVLAAGLLASYVPDARRGDKNEDLRAAARFLVGREQPGDAVAYDPAFAGLGVRVYLARERHGRPLPTDIETVPGAPIGRDGNEYAAQESPQRVAAALREHRRLWIVGYDGRTATWHPTPEPFETVERAGDLRGYRTDGVWRWGQIKVRLVQR